jgi:hypothetical protein
MRRRQAPAVTEVIETRTDLDAEPAVADMRALISAAAQMQLDTGSVIRAKVGDEEWQREAWRMYDIVGELRFAANRHAGALSQCRFYVADVDEQGNPGAECEDEDIAALAGTIFGGADQRADLLREIDLQLYVAGESYIIAESAADAESDIWYAVPASEVRKEGDRYKVKRPEEHGGGAHAIDPKQDIMVRCWTPHPKKHNIADSSVRSSLPVLREIERLTLLTFSQIDSRLISAGLLLLPHNVSFPKKDGSPGTIRDLLDMILEVAQAQLSGAGTAAGLVPILAGVPQGTGQDIQHIKFETALTAELKEKLDHAVRRLATGLDIDPQELLGMGDSNHWSAWQIDENGIKLFIQPVMTRICGALTTAYLHPALKAMGKDPSKYVLWFDPSALTVRPNRLEDALQLWDRGVINDEELRKSANITEDQAPNPKELAVWRAWQLVKADPALLANAEIAKLLGLPVVEQPGAALPPGMDPNALPPGADQQAQGGQDNAAQGDQGGRALPTQPDQTQQDGGAQYAALLPGAEQVVLRALELAGGRMLDRHQRGHHGDIAKFALHTRIRGIDRPRATQLLTGAFSHVPALAAHHDVRPDQLAFVLEEYCTELIVRGYAHSPELLREMLKHADA